MLIDFKQRPSIAPRGRPLSRRIWRTTHHCCNGKFRGAWYRHW